MSWLGEERRSKPKLRKKRLRDSKTSELKNSEKKERIRFAGDIVIDRLSKCSRESVEEREKNNPKQTHYLIKQQNEKSKT
jgi:hypothetical protein